MQEKQSHNRHSKKPTSAADFLKSPAALIVIGIIVVIVLVVIYLVATFGGSSTPVVGDVSSISVSSKNSSTTISSDVSSAESSSLSEPTETNADTSANFQDALDQNSDVIGWIKINGIDEVDLPVTQYDDNSYYLYRGLDKEYDYWGTVFADYRCAFTAGGIPSSRNTTLYGHNQGDYKYFAQLVNYCIDGGADLVNSSPYITYTTESGDITYRIFATFFTEITDANFQYIEPNPSDELFKHFIEEAKSRSETTIDCDVDVNDKILTLSTCTYRFKMADGKTATEDVRCVVMARELREGESIDDALTPAVDNPNAKQPTYKK